MRGKVLDIRHKAQGGSKKEKVKNGSLILNSYNLILVT